MLFPAFGQSNESDPDLVFALNSEGKGRKNLWKKDDYSAEINGRMERARASNSGKKNKDFVSIIIYYLSPVTRTYFHWEHVTCRTPEETSRLLFSLEFDVKRLLSDVALILSNQRRMMPPNSTTRNPMSLTNFPIANLEQFEDLETMLSQSADAMDDLV